MQALGEPGMHRREHVARLSPMQILPHLQHWLTLGGLQGHHNSEVLNQFMTHIFERIVSAPQAH